MKKRNIDKGFIVSLMYIIGVALLLIGLTRVRYMQYIEYENAQNYRVVRLNSDKNSVKDEEAYFFGDDDVIYRYDFETKETERLCESYKNRFVIYEDYVFCVEKTTPENSEYSECKVKRYNFHTGEDEILLENVPEIDDINICNSYLVYKIGESNYYLYPVTGNAEEEPIAVQSIFKERGDKTELNIQTVTYEGIDIVGRFSNEAGEVEYISLKDESSGMELLPRSATLLLDDGRLIWFDYFGYDMQYVDNHDDLEECEILTAVGSGSMYSSIGSDSERYEIECLNLMWPLGSYGAVPSRNMIQDGDEIICLMRSADTVYNEYTNETRVTVKGDVLFKWNMKTGESSILYASSDDAYAYTRVIGYKDGDIYLLHNRWVLVQSVGEKNQKRLFRIPGRREIYSFDWQGDYLIVTGTDGKILKAYKTE